MPPYLKPWPRIRGLERPTPALVDMLPGAMRQLVGLQRRLDEQARATFTRWDEAGVPPSAWSVSGLRLELALDLRSRPKRRLAERTDLCVSTPARRHSAVRMTVRFLRPTHTVEDLANGHG